jgi:hypothetical protein
LIGRRLVRRRALVGLLTALGPALWLPALLNAQDAEASVGRFFDSTGWTAYRLGLTRPLGGVFGLQLHGDLLRRDGGVGSLGGLGADLTAFRSRGEGPYLVAGVGGGLGSESSNGFSRLWGSWSAGGGYDLLPVSFLSVGAEGRWQELSLSGREGVRLSVGLSVHLGGGPAPRIPTRTSLKPAEPITLPAAAGGSLSTLTDSIVATATEAMGRPYTYGGTGADGEGFDCSGLIQHAYGKHGITLPRRSTDQAREGRKIDRQLKLLATADILTFSNRGGRVTHVGLYIGGGRFIHSATRGVQVSTLSAEDPYGRWWYRRWVGVRRVVP